MKRRILALVLTLCMLLSLVPMSALAVDTYGLYINEFRFTSSNLTYTGETGNAVYNPSTKTLTLNNLTISTKSVNTLIYSEIDGLNIQINGTLTINLLDSKPINGDNAATALPNYGFALNANTTIRGTNNSADKDCIIINSASVGVAKQEFEDGTTRVGIATGDGASLTMENITVRMTDNSTGSYAGHASMVRPSGTLNISGCKLEAQKCQLGVYMDANAAAATIRNTAFAMNLSGTNTSGVNYAPNTVNVLQNCSGSISATYPIYTSGQLTISGSSKLTLVTDKMGVVATQNGSNPSGKVIFDNANVEIQSENKGLQVEAGGSITMKSGTVTVTTASYGVQVLDGSSFAMEKGTLRICGVDSTSSVGISNYGTMTVTGGSLNAENVYTAIQNDSSTSLSVTGGEHTLTAATCGYLGGTSSELKISNTAKVTINAQTGIQLPAESGSKLTVSGGELNINTTDTGINLEDSTSAMTLSGGKVNITDKNASPTIYGMHCMGNTQFTGAEVTFSKCKNDMLIANSNSKMTGGKLHLSGNSSGAQLYIGFEMTGGVIDGSTGALGIVASQGTTTLKGGTVNITASYPFYLVYDGIVDFAGANVTGTSTANCGLYVKSGSETEPDSSSYKISGGTVVLTSTQAGANAMYTSIPSSYGVWAGADEAGATLVETPTQPILATSKYVRFTEKKAVTLTLVNVKEGASASYLPGESFTYTAQDALRDQHFSHWELTVGSSTTNVGTGTTYSGRMPAGNATLTAVYENCSGGTATCQKKPICSVCGKEYGILAAHKLTEEVEDEKYVITPATCESEGTYYKSCSVCGASAENWNNATFTVPALGHDWSDWASNGDGTHSRICGNDADHTEKEDCSGGTADCTHGPICDFCHAEYGKPGDHNYTAEVAESQYLKTEATCTEAAAYYKSCSGCDASSKGTASEATFSHGEAKGHDWSDWTSTGHDTHSRICGNDADHTEKEDCSGGTADCTHGPICDFCHAEYGKPGDHNYTAEVAEAKYLKTEATCTEAAVYYKSCTGCGASSQGIASEATFSFGRPLGHKYEWIVDQEATETEAGSKHEECTVCHDKKDPVEIPATGLVRDTKELQTLLDAGGTVKLEKDYTIISALNVNLPVILDLNGYTITSLCTETAYRALYVDRGYSLTLTDSSAGKTGRLTNEGTVHTGIYVSGGSFVMAGGTIDGFILDVVVRDRSTFTMTGGTLTGAADGLALGMFGGAGSEYAKKPTMYADGGTVDGNADFVNCTVTKSQGAADETVFNGEVTIMGCGDRMVTIRCGVFCGAVDNGGEIAGGIFYGGLTHIVDPENYDSDGRLGENAHAITFMDGETQHAIEVLDSGVASYAPVAPTKTNCTFDGWYNGDTKYIFGSAITEDLTLNAHWSVNQYTITFDTAGGSEINPITQDFGTDVTAPEAPTKAGYTFAGWDPEIPATMPAEDMTITAKWTKNSSGGGSSAPSYSISIPSKTDGGKVSVSPKNAKKGATVTITVTPDEGYVLDQLTVTDKSGNPVEIIDNGDGTYSFQQPSGKVEVTVTFVEVTVQDNRIVLTLGSPVATVLGEQVTNDVAPIARNNRTLLPIRFIAEALGATVDWNANLQKATVKQGELLIEIYLGQNTAYVGGNPVVLDVAAFAENNRTYLPLRFVAESLGAEVLWDQATQSITIIPA